MITPLKRAARAAMLAVASLAGGCYHPEARLDTVSPIAGNASAHNKAVQTIDPWPDHAFRRHQVTDGERVRRGYEGYRGGGKTGNATAGGEDAAAGGGDARPTAAASQP